MSKRMIFHAPFRLSENPESASALRPLKMIEAFKKIGYDVFVVAGTAKERKESIEKNLIDLRKGVKFDFCYSESSTMPTLLTEKNHFPVAPFLDFGFFRKLKEQSVPIALFYRDIYWNFDLYKRSLNVFKRIPALWFYKYDLKMYNKYIDLLLLPSLKMLDYIPVSMDIPKICSFPSGCDSVKIERNNNSGKKILSVLYVGGIKPPLYDLTPLFETVRNSADIYLKVVCRKQEYENTKKYYNLEKIKNIKIVHGGGNVVKDAFLQADVFSIVRCHDEYLSFAMPYKLFESISYELPVITNGGTVVADFVKANDIGWIVDDNYSVFFKDLNENRSLIQEKVRNIRKIKEENTWESRAQFVVNQLLFQREV